MNPTDQSTSGLSTSLRVLRRRIGVVVLCALTVPASALAVSLRQEKQYSASASLLFRDPQLDQKLFGSTFLAPSTDPTREAATNVELVSLKAVAARTERLLPKAGPVSDKIDVSAKGQSDVVSITATHPDPEMAAELANTFATEYIAFRREADRATIREAQELVTRQLDEIAPSQQSGRQARSLRERSQQLQIFASLQTGNAELVERAGPPSSPSSPKVARNGIVGGIMGLMLGVALAFLLERFDRRIREPKELEEIFDRPILGAIPESRALAKSGRTSDGLAAPEAEAFRMLRANLRYFNIDRDVKSVLVTSAAPGDGKTTVAWNLAAAAAGGGAKVLAIEADLRHPRFASGLGLHASIGLSTVLAGQVELEEAVKQMPASAGVNRSWDRTIDVVFAGPLPPNPTDLLESERMHEVLDKSERAYDFVVIDTPPTSVVSDAVPLVRRVGGVIVVGRLAKSTRDELTHLHIQLQNLNAPVLGVVVNAVSSDAAGYGYGSGNRYLLKESTDAPDAGAPDAGAPDAGAQDAGAPDADAQDAGAPDADAPDADAQDADAPDADAQEPEYTATTKLLLKDPSSAESGGEPVSGPTIPETETSPAREALVTRETLLEEAERRLGGRIGKQRAAHIVSNLRYLQARIRP